MNRTFVHKIFVWVLALAMVLTSVSLPQNTGQAQAATGLPGARSCTDSDGNVFLGGNYIEVGISKHGSFGTSQHPEDWVNNDSHTDKAFHSYNGYPGLGLQADQDGWNVGDSPLMGDFFLPGSPEERWSLAYKVDDVTRECRLADRMNTYDSSDWKTEPLAKDTSSGDTLQAQIQGVTVDDVQITITYTFGVDDMEYTTDVQIKNLGDKDITDTRFVRSFDPDQDQQLHNVFATYNKVICNPVSSKDAGTENYAMVVSRGPVTLGGFFFMTVDNRARASIMSNLYPNSAYDSSLWDDAPVTSKNYAEDSDVAISTSDTNGYIKNDVGIALTFNLDTIQAGKDDSLTYYSSLNPDVKESLDKLKKLLSFSISYKDEMISGFDGAGTYDISQDTSDKTWKLVINEDKTYQLFDSDENEVASGTYDEKKNLGIKFLEEWYGSTLTIQKRATEDTKYDPSEIEIPSRPDSPDNPQAPNADNSAPAEIVDSDVTTTMDSIVINGVPGQEYSIDDGKNWKMPGEDNKVSFTGLEAGKTYVIKTRVAATDSSLASKASDGLTVKTMQMFQDVVETSYEGEYDGKSHEIKAETKVEGAVVSYSTSLDGEYRSEPYSFKKGGTNTTIYYKLEKNGYYTLYGKLTARINRSAVKVIIQNEEKEYGQKDPEFTYLITKSGEVLDKKIGGISLERESGEDVGTYEIRGTYTPDEEDAYDVEFVNAELTVDPKPVTIEWQDTELIYNGKEQVPTAAVKGILDVDTCEVVVKGAQKDTNVKTGETVYQAYVEELSNTNYILPKEGLETTYTILPKPLKVTCENTTFVYNGNEQLPDVTVDGIYDSTDCTWKVDGAQTDANTEENPEYTAVISLLGEDAVNYALKAGEDTVSFTIENADQEAPVLTAVDETLCGKADGRIEGLSTDMEYRKKDEENTFKAITDKNILLPDGIYEVRRKAKKNYKPSPVTEVMIQKGRKLDILVPEKPVGFMLTSDVEKTVWKGTAVLTLKVAEGYSKLESFAVKAADKDGKNSRVIKEGSDGTYTVSGITADTRITVEGIADVTAPAGEIHVAENKWNDLLSTITFGKFFKESREVTITAEDAGTKVKSISYYLSDKALTQKEVESLQIENWKKYENPFSIEPDRKVIVYARLEDNAGNIRYLSTDGMVFDSIKPVIAGIKDGDECYIEKSYTVDVTDENLDSVYVTDGSDEYTNEDAVTVKDGSFTLSSDSEKTKKIIVVDKAGNQSQLTVKFVSLAKIKEGVKAEIDKQAEDGAAAVDKLKNLSDEEKEAAKDNIRKQAEAAKNNVDAAADRKTAEETQINAEQSLIEKVDEAKVSDYDKTKDDTAVGKINLIVKGDNKDSDADYRVGLCVGNTEVEKAENLKDGENVSFDKLPDGVYNLVVSDGTNHSTTMVTVKDGKVTTIDDVTVSAKNTTVEVKLNAPDAAVSGLDKIYNTEVYRENAKAVEAVESGKGSVDIKLTVENAKEDPDIISKISEDKQHGQFVDFKIDMKVTDPSGESQVFNIRDTKQLVLLARPLTEDEKERTGYVLYRKHEDGTTVQVEKLPELTETEKQASTREGFYIENDYLYVWAQKFSVYALAYDKENKPIQTPTPVPVPTVTPTSQPTFTPQATISPQPTFTPQGTTSPQPTVTPQVTVSPQPTFTPQAAASPQPTDTSQLTEVPQPSEAPEVSYVSAKQQRKNALILNAKLKVSQKGNKIRVSWGKLREAAGYDVYVQYCGKKFTVKSLNMVNNGNRTHIKIRKVNGRKLNLKKNYKIYVEAYKMNGSQKVVLGKTITAHIVGRKNAKGTNVKAIKLAKKSFRLNVGKRAKIKGKTILVDKEKKPLSDAHAKELRFASSNRKIVGVTKTGRIKARRKGRCIIYVYARNGYAKKVRVKVK